MKAIVQDRYGPPEQVLHLADVPPPAPRSDELLVRVHAASIHADIWHTVTGYPRVLRLMGGGLRRPTQRIPGTDLAGIVEAVGASVTRFQPGDAVFGQVVGENQWRNGGTFAEYAAVREDRVEPKPANVGFEEAAAVPTSGLIAHMNLVDGAHVRAGERVLVNGAGGSLGVFAVQIAKAHGAHVTAVDSAGKLEMLRRIGADHVIDFEKEDFTATPGAYNLVFDIASNRPFRAIRRALRPGGRFVLIGHDHYGAVGRRSLGSLPRVLGLLARSTVNKQIVGIPERPGTEHPLRVLKGLIENGRLVPVVDRTFPLEDAVAALRYLQEGTAQGKIVLTV